MDEARRTEAKLTGEINLLRRRKKQVASTHHLRNAHQGIVHHHGELISPCPVLATHDEVATLRGEVDGLRSVMPVRERHNALLFLRHSHTNGGRSASRVGRQIAARALINHSSVALMRCLCSEDVSTGAIARISHPLIGKHLQIMFVNVAALALPVRTLVPLQSEPSQVVHYQFCILAMRTLRVDILNTKQPLSALRLGRQP